ncbi:MAG: hypothetical protein M0007_13200 [Actinomycetota bacterium]|nr:hypothetical protein [Actinomycetota bacterium]
MSDRSPRARARLLSVVVLAIVTGLAAACSSTPTASGRSASGNGASKVSSSTTTTLPPASWSLIAADTLGQKSPGSIAVWTGTEVLIDHNGCCAGAGDVQLDAYVPSTNTWKATASTPLSPRNDPGMVWTDHDVIAFGGTGSADGGPPFRPLTDGAAYDPATNQWHAIAAMPQPFVATVGGAVWTGSDVLAWSFDATGHETFLSYNPTSNTWKVLPSSGMPAPEASTLTSGAPRGAGIVWTGSKLLVWRSNTNGSTAPMANGAAYDPSTNRWTALPAPPAPLGVGAAFAWTSKELVVWGGNSGSTMLATGAMYDPSTNRWRAMARSALPPTTYATAVWTGSTVFVSGGLISVSASGLADLSPSTATFDPATNTWATVASAPALASNAPPSGTAVATARDNPDLVWTGSQVIMLSGYDGAYQAPRPDGVVWTP